MCKLRQRNYLVIDPGAINEQKKADFNVVIRFSRRT